MALLIPILRNPQRLASLTLAQWQLLLSQSNASHLTGRLHYLLQREQITPPEQVRWHLESAYKVAERQRQQAIRELSEVVRALRPLDIPVVVLKGAAYIVKDLPCGFGRTFADIDLLVGRDNLERVEQQLRFAHWIKTEIDDYDEQYYRRWMHEIPPLRHTQRGTVLDIHHNILPVTNKDMPDASKFELDEIDVSGVGKVLTLSDRDVCIHAAVHLFTESEFHNGFRDLSDLDLLLRHYQSQDPEFVSMLLARAAELGLVDYVRLAVRYTHLVFKTPIGRLTLSSTAGPSTLLNWCQDFCFVSLFVPDHSSCRGWQYQFAVRLLYWRGHLLRMPLRLLVPHLLRKSLMRLQDAFRKEELSKPEIPRN